ncbi:MAG: Asparaginyl-tRNA synthetase [Candidatus Ozemobacter sibiricus]|jgi:asparaginyl-tRNA synthetase|uniref:Asparagine--tRNA ligase n=1 Tax=Candidatus Ozemobacter sibiricus TaxID=2268124 RepID=A0A367ZLE8_9BACT|nr:MAG: Asparaginyl-tRNA synthetase [Candidatus Ozemobacter sibiricus]
MLTPTIARLLQTPPSADPIEVQAWVRTKRTSKNVVFIALNDGSTIRNLQAVVNLDEGTIPESALANVTTGAAVRLKGNLIPSQGTEQAVELKTRTIEVLGAADPEQYPLQPKKHSFEFLREIAHLRFRTNVFGAVFRMRHAMTYAIHTFFHERGFFNIHTPIITASDCEGAGAMFRVTTLDPKSPPLLPDGSVDWSQDFFGRSTNLTVSGQLEAELAAMALGKVYTFGPTFRAENSNTSRHAAEFWMIEPEVAFADLNDNADLAEDFLKYLIKWALERCPDDMAFLNKRFEEEEKTKKQEERSEYNLLDKLRFVLENKFERITYTEAIEILRDSPPNKKKKFQYPVDRWGIDLQSEHERYLVEKHFKKPTILTDYPKEIKAFYMRLNDDGKTVRAMDVLAPGIGEIIGGSQREERYDVLQMKVDEMKIPRESIWWYLELRKFGTAVHSGFGLGFERFLMFVTGMSNIRDVQPFPRTPKSCEF